MLFPKTPVAAALALALLPPGSALAADTDRIRELERQLTEQKALMLQQQRMLERMEAELQQLKGAEPEPPAATVRQAAGKPPAEAEAPDHALDLQLYGHLQLDAIHDFKRVDPDYEATLRPSTIPTVDGTFGDDGSTLLSVRQSTMGLRGGADTPVGLVKGWFEFDMFGTGSNTGDTTFNLRHAWVEIGGLGFGQTNSNFMDIGIFPNVVDWWGPSGMAFNRNPQLRYTWALGEDEFALALEQPNASFNTGIFGEISPAFDDAATARTELPDLTARYRLAGHWGHLQLAGVLRRLEFETRGTPNNEPKFEDTGWGLNFTGAINSVGRDQIKFGLVYGEGIASFMNDGGVNLAPENFEEEPVPVLGTTLYYDRYWSGQWSSSIGFSINDANVRNQQADAEFDKGIYASANLLYTPYPAFLIGLEALYGRHEDVGGRSGEDFRTQVTFKHKFSTKF